MQSFKTGVGGRHALAHHFDDGMAAGNFNVFFAAAGGACRADVVVYEKSRANDRRIADTPGNFPGEAGSRGGSGNISLGVHRQAVDCAGGRMHHDVLDVLAPSQLFRSVQQQREFFLPFRTVQAGAPVFR